MVIEAKHFGYYFPKLSQAGVNAEGEVLKGSVGISQEHPGTRNIGD